MKISGKHQFIIMLLREDFELDLETPHTYQYKKRDYYLVENTSMQKDRVYMFYDSKTESYLTFSNRESPLNTQANSIDVIDIDFSNYKKAPEIHKIVLEKIKYILDIPKKEDSSQAMRFNEGKLKWSLVDFEALEPMVEVLMFGAEKYAPHNWKKGMPYSKVIDSLMRHLVELSEGKDIDAESGKRIIGHIMCNALFLSRYMNHNPELDDRYKKEAKEVKLDYDVHL